MSTNLNKHESYLEEVIKYFVPSFYWGKKGGPYQGHTVQTNILSGYFLSHSWWLRIFCFNKIKRKCALLEMALYYWLSSVKVNKDFVKEKERLSKYYKSGVYEEFINNVVNIHGLQHGILEENYIWEIYLALNTNGFVKHSVAGIYHGLAW